ncbi:hypothetical protein NBRC13296_12710 [Paenibacillus chitinolyticus]|uniref:hypothetical protein n=1 Tax=Paenibacillus chitinolyticus TaxID=79263 RepID=UPI0035562C23
MKLVKADNTQAIIRGLRLNNRFMIGFGWSRNKGDWWWKGSPRNAKLFDIRKTIGNEITKYGIYIARLSLVFMKKAEKED